MTTEQQMMYLLLSPKASKEIGSRILSAIVTEGGKPEEVHYTACLSAESTAEYMENFPDAVCRGPYPKNDIKSTGLDLVYKAPQTGHLIPNP